MYKPVVPKTTQAGMISDSATCIIAPSSSIGTSSREIKKRTKTTIASPLPASANLYNNAQIEPLDAKNEKISSHGSTGLPDMGVLLEQF